MPTALVDESGACTDIAHAIIEKHVWSTIPLDEHELREEQPKVRAVLQRSLGFQYEVRARQVTETERKVGIEAFRLLELPAELWIKIGNLTTQAMDPCYDRNLTFPDSIQGLRAYYRYARSRFQRLAITRTCKSLRTELLPVYYQTKINTMVVSYSITTDGGPVQE